MPGEFGAAPGGGAGQRARQPRGGVTAVAAALVSAALAAAYAAGCGVSYPPDAPSGLAGQVITGERIGAATRAQASRQPAESPVKAVPATASRKVAGRPVTAIGDSVMAASAMALESVLPGIYIDAVPSRQMQAGLAVVRRLAASGRLRPVVVVGLGTNYIVTPNELDRLLRLIGPDRRLVLINTYVPDAWSRQVNATMAAFIRRHRAVTLADWFDTIRHRTGLLWPDHVHPQLAGTSVYARMVYHAVQASLQAAVAAPGRRR